MAQWHGGCVRGDVSAWCAIRKYDMGTIIQKLRELRTPLTGIFAYASGCGDAGRAEWLNISRTGAAMRLGRYLRPGHVIQLLPELDDWVIPARIAWCAPIADTPHFRAGLAVERNCPESALRFATLGYQALALNKSHTNAVVTAVWPGFTSAELPTRLNALLQGGAATANVAGIFASCALSSR